jgi:Sulfatase
VSDDDDPQRDGPAEEPAGSSDATAGSIVSDTSTEQAPSETGSVKTHSVAESAADRAPATASRWQRWGGRDLLELFVLTGFAIAQPLLSETGKSPEFFTYRRLSSLSMVEYVLLVTFAPTAVLFAVEALAAVVFKPAARALHLLFVAVLAGSILVELGKGRPVPQGYALAVISGVVAIGLTVLVVRSATLRLYLHYASPAPLVFALLFVATSPSGAVVREAVGGSAPPVLATSVPTAQEAGSGSATPTQPTIATAPVGTKTVAHPPVVMIFFDEFPLRSLLKPDGTVNAALFPNFAWLSKNTNWFRNATGVSGFTPYAVPAMLRGEFPAKALPPVYASYKDNILAELSGTYNVSAAETITALCPTSVCKASAKASQATGLVPTISDSGKALKKIVSPFKDKSDPTTEFADSGSATPDTTSSADKAAATCTTTECLFVNLGADQPSRMKAFVNTLVPTPVNAKPTFRFLHVLLPHGPWHFDQNGRPYPYPAVGPGHANSGGWLNQAWPVQVNLAREMLQLSYADKLLGDVLTKMRAENILDKTLLVVTADHGEGFVPGEQARTMDAATAADLSWIPMFLKMPGETQGKLDERNWTHVDLVATLADALHVKLPQTLAGQSALQPPRTTTVKYWYNTPGKQLVIPDPVGNYHKVIKGYGGVLGNAKSAADLYKLGPRPDLLGRQLATLHKGASSSLTLSLNGAVKSAARAVTPTSTVPTLIYGHLNGKTGGTVAIVVNGVVGAVVPTYADNGAPLSIEALVPATLWHNGVNDIEAYMVTGTGAATQLHHVGNS